VRIKIKETVSAKISSRIGSSNIITVNFYLKWMSCSFMDSHYVRFWSVSNKSLIKSLKKRFTTSIISMNLQMLFSYIGFRLKQKSISFCFLVYDYFERNKKKTFLFPRQRTFHNNPNPNIHTLNSFIKIHLRILFFLSSTLNFKFYALLNIFSLI
jgi:hypothetical protein